MPKDQTRPRADWRSFRRDRVLRMVRRHVENHQPPGYRLRLNEHAVKKDPSQWVMVVEPESGDIEVDLMDYSHRLVVIEEEIEKEEGLPVFLVPLLIED